MSEESEEKDEKLFEKKENQNEKADEVSAKNQKNSTEELKERKKLIAIYFLSGLIALSIVIFALVFKFFPDLTTGKIECTYYSYGKEIYIFNQNYEKDEELEVLINDKENDEEKPKYNKKEEGNFTVEIKTTKDEIKLDNMFKSTNVKTIKMSSEKEVKINSMIGSFANCSLLEKFEISGFDTSDVTNMSRLFFNDTRLTEVDIVKMKTNKLKNIDFMFAYTNISEIDLSNFNIELLANSTGVFKNCTATIKLKKEYESKVNETEKFKKLYPNITINFTN